MFKLFLEKAKEPEIKFPDGSHYICQIIKKAREFHKNIYLCFIDFSIAFDCVDHNKLWDYQTTWPASWEIRMQVRKQQLELDVEQQTGSK